MGMLNLVSCHRDASPLVLGYLVGPKLDETNYNCMVLSEFWGRKWTKLVVLENTIRYSLASLAVVHGACSFITSES
jgi:hypothetical protein